MMSQSKPPTWTGPLFSPLLEAAVRLAAQGHYHQFRKRSPEEESCGDIAGGPLPETCIPYITHLMGSMCILARLGARDEVLAAALLHDYLEDVPDPDGQQTIRRAVGPEVLDLVVAVTEDKRDDLADSETWETRKREQIAQIDAMSDDAVLIKAADLLHNIQTLLTDLDATDRTTSVWERLNAGPDRQLWYFSAVLEAAERRLGAHPLVRELERAVGELGRQVEDPSAEAPR
jgi:hypothetical protein